MQINLFIVLFPLLHQKHQLSVVGTWRQNQNTWVFAAEAAAEVWHGTLSSSCCLVARSKVVFKKQLRFQIGVFLTETELSGGRRLWQESSGMGWWQTKSQAHLPAALHAQSTRDWNFELILAVIAFENFPEILHFPGSNPHNLCNIPLYFENELFNPFPLDKLPFERSVQQEMLTSRPRLNQS